MAKVETGSFPRIYQEFRDRGFCNPIIRYRTDVDQLTTVGAELTYNVAHWKFGLEYTFSSAWYGSMDTSNGKIKDTHSISNHRVVGVAMFMF